MWRLSITSRHAPTPRGDSGIAKLEEVAVLISCIELRTFVDERSGGLVMIPS